MNRRELREWLSLAPADIPLWLAFAAIVALYFVQNSIGDMTLSATALTLSIIACFMGMRPDENFSEATNAMKLVGYPLGVLVVLAAIYLNLTGWMGRHP